MKNTSLFTYSTNILVRLLTENKKELSYPKNSKVCDHILVTLLKMRPHYSQSSGNNATPSSAHPSLALYKKVPSPRPQPTTQGKKSGGRQTNKANSLRNLICGSFNFPTSLTATTIVFLQLILSLELGLSSTKTKKR